MAEDHGLSDGDGPIQVTQGLELLISVIAQHIILLDGVQCLLLALQLDNVWVWDHFLGKLPDRVFEGGREKQHLAVPGQHPAREDPGTGHDPESFLERTEDSGPGLAWATCPGKQRKREENSGEEVRAATGQEWGWG